MRPSGKLGGVRFVFGLAAAALFASSATRSEACPFCGMAGERFLDRINKAPVVIYGSLSNPRLTPDADGGRSSGTTDMKVLKVIKGHPAINGKKETQLNQYLPIAKEGPNNFVIFADVRDNQVSPYMAIPNEPKDFLDYLTGAMKLEKAKTGERLAYFFKYLDHESEDVARDAYMEFAVLPFKDVEASAKAFDPNKVVRWLADKKTQPYKFGLLGLMAGVCGRPSDAPALRRIIESADLRPITGVDGLMAGYCLLEPSKGPDLVLDVLTKAENDFNYRYAALRTCQFLVKEIPRVDRAMIYKRMSKALDTADIADMIIDEMRKGKVWEYLKPIVAIYDAPRFANQPLVRRSVVKFALQCPREEAKDFLKALRQKDPQTVAIEEDNLRFEENQSQPSKDTANTKT